MVKIIKAQNNEEIHSGDFADIRECLADGVIKGVSFKSADLRGADLRGADLRDADLWGANLTKGSTYIGTGEAYRLFISPEVVQVGRQSHTPAAWRAMSKRHLAAMDSGGHAVKYYPRLLYLLDFYLGRGARPEWVTS